MSEPGRTRKSSSAAARNLKRRDTFQYQLVLEGALIGIVVGAVIAAFRLLLAKADELRGMMAGFANTGAGPAVICFAILMAIAAAIVLLLKFEPDTAGSGIPQVEGELKGRIEQSWWKVILGKFAGCILAIGGGLALGREGPSIQIGAMIGKGFSRKNGRLLTEERMLMTCGAGAGLAAAFGAPLAGAIFSLEELHKNFSAEVLISTMAAAAAADYVAVNIIGLTPVFNFDVTHRLPLKYYWAVLILGALLGVFGAFYNRMLAWMQDAFDALGHSWIKMAVIMTVAFVLMFAYPIALGSGNELVAQISTGRFALKALAVMLLIKFFFSTASFGSGSPGGIFLPLLVLGAITGGLFCRMLGVCVGMDQTYITSFVVIAMSGYFAAIVRAPVTGIILITEMTGDFSSLLALTATSMIAYVVADMMGGIPVYEQLLRRSLVHARAERITGRSGKKKESFVMNTGTGKDETPVPVSTRERKIVLDSEVYYGSYMDGKKVAELDMPQGSLIVTVMRDGKELIPNGRTKLLGGDELEILCRNSDIAATQRMLDERCKSIMKDGGKTL